MRAWLRADRVDRVDAHCNGLGDVESTTWWLTTDGERRSVRVDGVVDSEAGRITLYDEKFSR